jgi:hypothetical protein
MVLCYVVSSGLGFDDSIIGGVAFSLSNSLLCFALLDLLDLVSLA